ncbi:nuclear transport factor 2 family protein [Rhizobium tumorigenes]|uniref:nuclear transport factor 2 family protein n=1 Tax=Rhizobium tumorigenes TaxID=2041385 RepID=UPI00241CC900|nr:nuclear transport factor 2 family protein [Rhizobium tumorigenes]WFS03297.1 nuclear transport factor 2 family protein [Rhizobium tumorigenes]
MKRFLVAAAIMGLAHTVSAQEAVVGADNPDALFTSSDPKLNTNKQAAYNIVKVLLEANHWEMADKYLTARYLQHNPNAVSGRQGVIDYFTKVLNKQPSAIPDKMRTKIVSVVAEGDIVTVSYPREVKDAKDPSKSYTTTWFDSWRFVDGKADEHWDPATKPN